MFQLLPALLLASASWMNAAPALADERIQCAVTSVHDGDSMRVRCPGDRHTTAVRMQQIDAPELEQAYGTRARDHLRQLCRVGSVATIETQGHDQYGRLLGDVYCADKSVNEEMVSSGSAWLYDRYVQDRGLYKLQDAAKAAQRGLWAGSDPEAPWRWRYRQRHGN